MDTRHQKDNDHTPLFFSNTTPHFFTVVLQNTIRDKRLLIPKKFLEQHGNTLSDSVFVKLPCGSKWKMELEKSDRSVWLRNGWQEFVNHNSIEFGHFLVFRYQGGSRFDAFIFDKTTVEIDYYPLDCSRYKEPNAEDTQVDDSFEIQEELRADKIGATKRNISYIGTTRASVTRTNPLKRKRDVISNTESDSRIDSDIGNLGPSGQNGKRITQGNVRYKPTVPTFTGYSFRKIVTQAILNSSSPTLGLPADFGRKYLGHHQRKQIITLELGGSSWDVTVHFYPPRSWLLCGAGFKGFVRENVSNTGDICVYKLINDNPFVFEVSILPANGH